MTSKSFGYALSAILYLTEEPRVRKPVQLKEIARHLHAPKYFLGKILMQLVKNGLLQSQKGPNGGFSATSRTISAPLLKLLELTGRSNQLDICILRLKKCSSRNKCPLHDKVVENRNQFLHIFSTTTIQDLMSISRDADRETELPERFKEATFSR